MKYALIRIDGPYDVPEGTAFVAEGGAAAVFEAAARLCSEAELNAARLRLIPRELRSRVEPARAAELAEYLRN